MYENCRDNKYFLINLDTEARNRLLKLGNDSITKIWLCKVMSEKSGWQATKSPTLNPPLRVFLELTYFIFYSSFKPVLLMRFYCLLSVFYLWFVRSSHWEVFVKQLFVQIKQSPWKMPVKVFIVTKVAGCRPLTLLILTLSQICFKNSAKITTLCFRKWLINVQLAKRMYH